MAKTIARTLNTIPKGATHWSIRSMAAETGLSHTTIRRFCRWRPASPSGGRTPNVCNGTPSLFAALVIATGAVIGKCYKRHRATEFLDFLKQMMPRCPKNRMYTQ